MIVNRPENNVELRNCNFVKAILMFAVVLNHSICFWEGGWFTDNPIFDSSILSIVSSWFGSFHIHGFTLVSGYIFYFLKYEKNKYSNFIPFIKNKAKRLLMPYVFVAIIWVIPIYCLFFDVTAYDILNRYLLATSPSQLWFLIMLFDVFVIFWLLSDFFEKHSIIGAVVVLGFWAIGTVGGTVIPNVFMIWTALQYIPLFWIGFKIRQYGSTILMKIPAIIWMIVDIALFALVRYLSDLDAFILKALNLGFTFVLHIIGALMAFVVLQKIANKIKWDNSFFNFISNRSMPVYLIHQQVIYFMIYLLNGVVNPYIHAGINFVVAMSAYLILSTILMKFKVTSFLIGEKGAQ